MPDNKLKFIAQYPTGDTARYKSNRPVAGYEIELLRANDLYVVQAIPSTDLTLSSKKNRQVFISTPFKAASDQDALDKIPDLLIQWLDKNISHWTELKEQFIQNLY